MGTLTLSLSLSPSPSPTRYAYYEDMGNGISAEGCAKILEAAQAFGGDDPHARGAPSGSETTISA